MYYLAASQVVEQGTFSNTASSIHLHAELLAPMLECKKLTFVECLQALLFSTVGIPTSSLPSIFPPPPSQQLQPLSLLFMTTVPLLFWYFHYCYLSRKDKTENVNISEI